MKVKIITYSNIELTQLALQLADAWQDSFLQLKTATQNHATNAMTILAYTMNVLKQPLIIILDVEFRQYENECNQYLIEAKKHAEDYLNNIYGRILDQIASLKRLCCYIQNIANFINDGATDQDMDDILSALSDIINYSLAYRDDAHFICQILSDFRMNVGNDASHFSTVASDFQQTMTGQQHKLAGINIQLADITQQIYVDIQQQVHAAVKIEQAIIQINSGAIGKLFTLDTNTPILLAGISIIAKGKAEQQQIAADLNYQLRQKNEMAMEIYRIQSHLSQVQLISQGYAALSQQALDAQTAAQGMVDSWSDLTGNLNNLINLLKELDNKNAFKVLVQLFNKALVADIDDVIRCVAHIEQQTEDLRHQLQALQKGLPNWLSTQLGQGSAYILTNYHKPVYALF